MDANLHAPCTHPNETAALSVRLRRVAGAQEVPARGDVGAARGFRGGDTSVVVLP